MGDAGEAPTAPKRGGWAAALLNLEDEEDLLDELAPDAEGAEKSVPDNALATMESAAASIATAPDASGMAMAPMPASAQQIPAATQMAMSAGQMPAAAMAMASQIDAMAVQMLAQQVMMTMSILAALQEGPVGAQGQPVGVSIGPKPQGSVVVSLQNLEKAKQYQRLSSKKDNDQLTIFVGGLRKTTDEDQVFAHFSKYGSVEQVDIKRGHDGASRGFAFVRFGDEDTLDRVLEARAKHIIDNKWIGIQRRDSIAANAGRAKTLAKQNVEPPMQKEEPKEEAPDEEEFTKKYLSLAQQAGAREQQQAAMAEAQKNGMVPMVPVMMPMMGGGMGGMMMGGGGSGGMSQGGGRRGGRSRSRGKQPQGGYGNARKGSGKGYKGW